MKIIIVGCGKIGRTILSSLVSEGHDVVAIDADPDALAQVTNVYDVIGVCGNGNDCATLEEADVEKAQLFVAVTGSDEFNMLSCFLAKKMGVPHTIARIRNPEYNNRSLGFMCQQLDISMAINPERLAAEEMFRILRLPAAVKIETFSSRDFEMIELRLVRDSRLDGMTLAEVRKKYQAKFLVCAVQRGEKVYIPDGNFTLQGGDRIAVTAAPSEIQRLLRMLDIRYRKARSIMILGATTTAFYLAKAMLAGGSAVKILDPSKERCLDFCDKLPGVVMIHGDAMQDALMEEGIGLADAFVALTGIDEKNILLSLFAASQKVPKVISKINRDEFATMAEDMGLDCIVSLEKTSSDVVVRYARALQNSMGSKMETLYKLMDGKTEVLEFNVQPDCRLVNIPLRDLRTKKNILLAGIIRGRKTIIPAGEDMILPGDRVIITAAGLRINDLSDIV